MREIKKPKGSICIECKHHYQANKSDIWYNQICKAIRPKEYFDYILGVWKFEDYPYCREINNNGECRYFEGK